MKKLFALLAVFIMCTAILTGCSGSGSGMSESTYKMKVGTTLNSYLTGYISTSNYIINTIGKMESFDKKKFEELSSFVEGQFETDRKWIDTIREIDPPSTMKDFHKELLGLINRMTRSNDKLVNALDAETYEKLYKLIDDWDNDLQDLGRELEDFADENEWLGDALTALK